MPLKAPAGFLVLLRPYNERIVIMTAKKKPAAKKAATKTMTNTDVKGASKQVPDLEVFGNGDSFKLICKASSQKEDWMKSTKAMPIPGLGCVVQVTTQQGNNIAEAVCFVPGAVIHERRSEGVVIERTLVKQQG